uniref:Putative nuclease HARBI1 n=1 Tax=Labrus bergylta TaxID=56723 RepID=A0A3Q3GWN6_9LABR
MVVLVEPNILEVVCSLKRTTALYYRFIIKNTLKLPNINRLELFENQQKTQPFKLDTWCSSAVPVPVQVLSTLGSLATEREIGVRSCISQQTISRTMPAVCAAIKVLSAQYIRFPFNDAQQTVIKRGFYEIAGFPNVTGAIDCTHMRLKPLSMNDYAHINCKNYHSIDVQIICNAKLSLLNVVARWPGGMHDTFIMQNSSVGTRLQEGALQGQSHLLGDNGYPLSDYLVTPLANPATEQERRFNGAHICTRATVERCIGLLKWRCRCLGSAGETLLYTLRKVCDMVLACGVLHNIAQTNQVPFKELQPDEPMQREL